MSSTPPPISSFGAPPPSPPPPPPPPRKSKLPLIAVIVVVVVAVAVVGGYLALRPSPSSSGTASCPGGCITISSFTADPNPVDTGSSTTISTTASGGSGALTYAYSGLPGGCASSNSSSISCAPTSSGSSVVSVQVTDHDGASASDTLTLTVTTPTGKTYALGMAPGASSVNGLDTVYYDNLSISPTSGLTTSLFGLKITTPSDSPVTIAAAPSACVVGPSSDVAPCVEAAPGSVAWYVVLVSAEGYVLATYPTTAASTTWNGGTVTVVASDQLVVISGAPLAGTGDAIACFGTGSSPVTGSATL